MINTTGTWGFFDWTDPFGGFIYKYSLLTLTGNTTLTNTKSITLVLNGNVLMGPKLESIRVDDHVSNGVVIQWEKLFNNSITYIYIDNVLVGVTENNYYISSIITPEDRGIIELYEVHPSVTEDILAPVRDVIPGDKVLLSWETPV